MRYFKTIAFAGLLLFGSTTAQAAEITVKKGDTLWDLGNQYGVPYQEIQAVNNLSSDLILIGQELTIPEGRSKTVTANPQPQVQTVNRNYSQSEIDILASLVQAEAQGESHLGKVAVAAVVLNRVDSSEFPDTIRGVIYQRGQFSPVSNGSINKRANSECYKAVADALSGQDPTNGALYFYEPRVVPNSWQNTLTLTKVIGNHNFSK